ncbi:CLUMA_CG015920, isoform A [Clunio marinus]|uniref:CLUMA_CG015920, isoform A n=1 Tax=Clunio marinus TaxID=568069 RepID=A0A1J1IVH9_9DIPT|nr:CLUMA_CG015920, isoform A [Clunio marinus]
MHMKGRFATLQAITLLLASNRFHSSIIPIKLGNTEIGAQGILPIIILSRRETFSFRRMKGINNNFCSMEEIKSELLKTFFLLYLQLTRFVTSYLPLFLNQQNHHHHILDKNNLILCKTNNLCATNNGSDGTINTKNYYNHSCHHNSHNWSKRKCTKISRKNG